MKFQQMNKFVIGLLASFLVFQLSACTDQEKPEIKPESSANSSRFSSNAEVAPAPEESKTTEAVSSSTASTAAETTQNKNQTEASAPMVEEEEKEPDCE